MITASGVSKKPGAVHKKPGAVQRDVAVQYLGVEKCRASLHVEATHRRGRHWLRVVPATQMWVGTSHVRVAGARSVFESCNDALVEERLDFLSCVA